MKWMACVALALLPCTAPAQASLVQIPLAPDLTVTTAIAEPQGDYESRKRLAVRDEEGWWLEYSASVPDAGEPATIRSARRLHFDDLASARTYRNHFESDTQEDYPGTTALGTSSIVLEELHGMGRARFSVVGEQRFMQGALEGFEFAAGLFDNPNLRFKGELETGEKGHLTVLVNGIEQPLPVLHAKGRLTATDEAIIDAELAFLDQSDNPLALTWRIGDKTLRVVRIDFPSPTPEAVADAEPSAPAPSAELQQKKRIVLPGLYFDFASAVLQPESGRALREIVAIANAVEGTLRIEGHTDAIGSDARNLALSKARAEAVCSALIALDPSLQSRLIAVGFGETRPVASNDTLEGRARNRRVELALQE